LTPYRNLRSFATLRRIIARLRGPNGCPWDRKQTPQSLKTSFLEEAYEVLHAIDARDPAELRDELGDLMLHIMLQAQIAAEGDKFTIDDVLESINRKLIHRHPHIFAGRKVDGVGEIMANWEVLKREERPEGKSLLDSVPGEMPALARSQSLQRRVAMVGFDWPEDASVIEKLSEEVGELGRAGEDEKAKEFGDILFTLANIGRRWNIDLEAALRGANERFRERFQCMEGLCRQRGLDFSRLTLDEQNALWNEAKRQIGQS
jgi:tetrapyrrole methylase family protein/MazG family protein